MGHGYEFHCSCGYKKIFRLGAGFAFPYVYRDLISKARKGEFGKTIKDLCFNNKYAAIDAEKKLFCCQKCNNLKDDYSLDIYYPTDIDYVHDCFDRYDGEPYFSWFDFKYRFKLEYKHTHKCKKCKETMFEVDTSYYSVLSVKCPKCGNKIDNVYSLDWD